MIFYVALALCVVAAVTCVAIGFNGDLQGRLILLGERIKGAPLNHAVWHRRFIL